MPQAKLLSRNETLLIIIQGLFFFAGSISQIFLNIYLFKIGGFTTVTEFNVIAYILMLLSFNTSGYLLAKTPTKHLIIASMIIFSVFWLVMFIFKENSIHILIPLGIIYAIGQGLFWSGNNLTQYLFTHKDGRHDYFGKLFALTNFTRALAPILAGAIIFWGNRMPVLNIDGYGFVFLFVVGVDLVTCFLAWKLPGIHGVEFSFRHIVKHKRNRSWKMVLVQQFILGLFDVSSTTIMGILIFFILSDELSVGWYNSMSLVISALLYLIAARLIRRNRYVPLFAGIICSISILITGFQVNYIGLGGYLVAMAVWSFVNIPINGNILNAIDRNPDSWTEKYHMFLERDTVLGLARIISYITLLGAFTWIGKNNVALGYVKLIAVFPAVLGLLVTLNNSKFISPD